MRVELDRFPAEVKARLDLTFAYIAPMGRGSLASAADPAKNLMIAATSLVNPAEATKLLEDAGMTVHSGTWLLESFELDDAPVTTGYVAAIAYRTREAKPGVWLDAYDHEPTPAEVLKRLFDEFRETGELPEVTFEEFLRLAHPNVAVISPDEIVRYIERNTVETVQG